MFDSCKMVEKQSEAFHTFLWYFFPSLKQNFIAYRSSKVSDCIFEIHQLWQSGFSRVNSNCCCSCSLESEIIKIGQSSHKIYSNNILNFQVSTTILNARRKRKLIVFTLNRDPHGTTTPGHSAPGSNGDETVPPYSPKLQHYWNLTIELFSVITGHSLVGYHPLQRCSRCSLQPQPTGQYIVKWKNSFISDNSV